MSSTGSDGAGSERLNRLLGFLEQDPGNWQLINDAAAEAIRVGDSDRARSLIDRGLALAGLDAGRRFALGNLMLANQDASRAEALFAELAQQGGLHPALSYNLGYAQFEQGRYADSIATLRQIGDAEVVQAPQRDLLLAKAFYFLQDLDAALEHIDRYLRGSKDDQEGLGLKALMVFDMGKPAEATAVASRLLALNPNNAYGHLTLGSIALEQKQPAVAKAHIEQTLAQQPLMGRAWSVLAFADLQQNQLEAGQAHFDKAVRYMPNHLGTWHGLAWTQLLLGNITAARQAVDSAMALDRNFAENHGTLAVIQVLCGQLDEAETSIKRGIRLDPKSPSSQYARSLLLAERQQPEASKRLIERILTEAGMKDAAAIAAAAVNFRPGHRGLGTPPAQALAPDGKRILH